MTVTLLPLVAPWALVLLGSLAVLIAGFILWQGLRGAVLRAFALALLMLALLNPVVSSEEREPLSTVVAVVVDRSQSQQSGERTATADAALATLKSRLAAYPNIDVREVSVTNDETEERPSTRMFSALTAALSDAPAARIGGAFFITDGQIHDIPANASLPGFNTPLHGLITGRPSEFDRRIEFASAPRFGIVGQDSQLRFRLIDDGPVPQGPSDVIVTLNGDEIARQSAVPGADMPLNFRLPRAGNNIVELSFAPIAAEISTANNRAVQVIDGIRQNLRVLLVSGEPHSGERTWRNLLKSDAAVDLVHFTILRPPEKQDGTPINELSLIAFPTQELFIDKIDEFDLIIFDRYQHRGVLPIVYYDNIAQYVQRGGALLIAAGPEHAGEDSVALTPLSSILPASPTGLMNDAPFYPRLSEDGKKHPVTRGLEGSQSEPPKWGRWFRTVDVDSPKGTTVMEGANGKPLLVLDRVGEGRVAMLLSDQGWLWARGFEGGGPHASLYRRMAHWLMKEPALEEEALTARAFGRTLDVTRQTLKDAPGEATLTLPSGEIQPLTLNPDAPGQFKAEVATTQTGLFEVKNGDLSALVHVGAVDAPEFKATVSTTDTLAPIAKATKGTVHRLLASDGSATAMPQILPVNGTVRVQDDQRMAVRMTNESVLKGINSLPLFAGFAGMAALLLLISATWYREGR